VWSGGEEKKPVKTSAADERHSPPRPSPVQDLYVVDRLSRFGGIYAAAAEC